MTRAGPADGTRCARRRTVTTRGGHSVGQTSRTCRRPAPEPYWPHVGQAIWGNFFARQAGLGQVTNVGTPAFHCARRDRVLLRDILRFGTATVISPGSRRLHRRRRARRRPRAGGAPEAPPTGG